MSLVECSNLSIGYDKKIIINDLSFTVNKGDYLCIVGENGAGKSTLIKGLLHLLPLYKGNITYSDELINKRIGYLPQQADIQKDFPSLVMEIVLSGCINKLGFHPFYSKKEKEIAYRNLELLGISDLSKKSYANLSGGQKQRTLLARALCASEEILFLDEPITGLDPKTTNDLYALLKQLNDKGVTIVMITHDLHLAFNNASHVLHIGKKNFYGTKESYINNDLGKSFIYQNLGEENG